MSVNDDELRQVFDAFDEDKNGEISPKELFNYMVVMFDTDGDAKISWDEFKNGIIKYLEEKK
ncbi:hypothetical protein LSH36_880g00047 [Paralvinella palmiformis]|uniref:EF-hand domain-containing protein n=1 Tax=Paralvinella palmiformis TaxID=53620 RepID=A0AAD9IYT4_9ANNE|nr:hypothetical protein LSH36_880g00047 [Paralvinella palmiformis]